MNRDKYFRVAFPGFHLYRGADKGVLGGVIQILGQRHREQIAVAANGKCGIRNRDLDRMARHAPALLFECSRHKLLEDNLVLGNVQLLRLQLCRLQQPRAQEAQLA